MREELERDLSQLDYQMRLRRHIMLHYIPPHIGGFLMLWVVFGLNGDGLGIRALLLIALLQAAALIFEGILQRRLVLRQMLPRKRELESLRAKLG